MEQHPIPRQITTFEFKLIGFLTLHQFIYLIVFAPLGYVVYAIFPIPYLNMALGAATAGIGAALAFLPINERPLDVWIKNFVRRLTSPTQYMFHKENKPLYFLDNLFFVENPHQTVSHVESQEKVAAYLAASSPTVVRNKKKDIHALFSLPFHQEKKTVAPTTLIHYTPISERMRQAVAVSAVTAPQGERKPFFTGVIKNYKLIPIPGILIYVKDAKGNTVRLLKSNPRGVFATFSALPSATYTLEARDPKSTYYFDTMKVAFDNTNQRPLEIHSKELL